MRAAHRRGGVNSSRLQDHPPDHATLLQVIQRFARFIFEIPKEKQHFIPPALLSSDLATMQEAVRVFGFQEMKVQGYSTEQVLARLQGR